jgi:hypothetical protein
MNGRMTDELKRIWKEAIFASEVLPRCLPEEAWDKHEEPLMIGGLPAEIRTILIKV